MWKVGIHSFIWNNINIEIKTVKNLKEFHYLKKVSTYSKAVK